MYDSEFSAWREESLTNRLKDPHFAGQSLRWVSDAVKHHYSYHFNWMGVPVIQQPEDLIVFQEIVWATRPDVIVECGVARGGSLLFWCSMLELIGKPARVVGVDIAFHNHTKTAISESKYSSEISLIQGDSSNKEVLNKIRKTIRDTDKVMVVLDSNHTEEHVLKELAMYANLVSEGAYLLVLDTVIEFLEKDEQRPWGPGNSPWTAVQEFMQGRDDFVNDLVLERKLAATVAPNGYWLKQKKQVDQKINLKGPE